MLTRMLIVHVEENLWTVLEVGKQLWMSRVRHKPLRAWVGAVPHKNGRAFGLVAATRHRSCNLRQLLRVGVDNKVSNERELDDH
jgi:hypothetical protein